VTEPRLRRDKSGFFRDLLATLKVWGRHPVLPVLSVTFWSLPHVVELPARSQPACVPGEACGITFADAVGFMLGGLAFLWLAGWVGTERVWYLRAFAGTSITARQAWRFTYAFMGRYVRLGILASLVFVPFAVVGLVSPSLGHIAFIVGGAVSNIALTFVTPALAFSTRRATEAIRIGLTTIGRTWPRSAPYVLIPALVMALIRTPEWKTSRIGYVATLAGLGLANLWFKGAVARMYLRHHDTHPEFGAANLSDHQDVQPSPDYPAGMDGSSPA